MPSWISKFGKWTPAKEYVVDPKAPKGKEVYEGPDRAALLELKIADQEFLGEDYRMNSDLIIKARQLGYTDVDKFLKEVYNVDRASMEKKNEILDKIVVDHKDAPRVKAIKQEGGGTDRANPSNSISGDFGVPSTLSGKVKE